MHGLEPRPGWIPGLNPFVPKTQETERFRHRIFSILKRYRIPLKFRDLLTADEDLIALIANLINLDAKLTGAWDLKVFSLTWLGNHHRFARYAAFGDELDPTLYVLAEIDRRFVQLGFHLRGIVTEGFIYDAEVRHLRHRARRVAKLLLRWMLAIRKGDRKAKRAKRDFEYWYDAAREREIDSLIGSKLPSHKSLAIPSPFDDQRPDWP